MVSQSNDRVVNATAAHVNEKIRRQGQRSVAFFAEHPELIGRRIQELDAEWDIERCLETGASSLMLFSMLRVLMGRSRWMLVGLAVPGFLLQHAIQGWCPPLEVFRRLGFRTRGEIDEEKYALKALRGDFRQRSAGDGIPSASNRAKKPGRAARLKEQTDEQ